MTFQEATIEPPQYTEGELREIFTREAGLKFMPPAEFNLPTEYNFQALEGIGVSETDLRGGIESLTGYLKDPVIVDENFEPGRDKERVERRKQLIDKFGKIAENLILHNRLRHNRIMVISSKFELWASRTKYPKFQDWEGAGKIQEFARAFPAEMYRGWDELPFKKKLKIIEQVTNIIADFLRFCAKK